MTERDCRWQFAVLIMLFSGGLGACVAVVAWPFVAWPFTNDISFAECKPKLSCMSGACLLVWKPWTDPPCPLQRACISFQSMTGPMGVTFKECERGKKATDWCYSGHDEPPPPVVVTCGGYYWFCNCRDQLNGDCNGSNTPNGTPPGICDCKGVPGQMTTHGVTNLCV